MHRFARRGRALEIGFGYGRDLVSLAAHGLAVTGLDPSDATRALAEQRLRARRLSAQLMTADFTEATLPVARSTRC